MWPTRADGISCEIPSTMPSPARRIRSEEHTSELQSPCNLVCRLLLEKKKKITSEEGELALVAEGRVERSGEGRLRRRESLVQGVLQGAEETVFMSGIHVVNTVCEVGS